MRLQAIHSIWFVLGLSLLPQACSSGKSSVKEAEGKPEIKAGAEVEMGKTFTVSLTKPELVKSVRWVALSESGAELSTCEGVTSQTLKCTAQEPGKVEVRAYTKLRNNLDAYATKSITVLDPDRFDNQKPVLVAVLSAPSSSGRTVVVSSLRSKNEGDAYFVQGETITLDLAQSYDPGADASAVIRFSIDDGTGAGYEDVTNRVATVSYPEPGARTIKIKAIDAQGHVTEKEFQVFVQCSAPNNVSIDTGKISVTKVAGENNFFQYSAAGAVAGGSGEFLYQWDFNGDGASESAGHNIDGETAGAWFSLPTVKRDRPDSPGVYTQFEGPRKLTLKALDKKCFYFAKASFDHTFVITRADGVPGTKQGPQVPNHLFIQGEVTPKGFTDVGVAVKDIATHKMGDTTAPRRVECSYNRSELKDGQTVRDATFSVRGLYAYKKPTGLKEYSHGLELKVSGIKDPVPAGGSGAADTSGAKVTTMRFSTDGIGDVKVDRVFSGTQGCTTQLSVDLTAGPGVPCGPNGEGTQGSYAAIIDGTYSCPDVKDELGRAAQIDKGAFYCEVQVLDACVGGCCCGGGVQPKPR